MTGDSGYPLQGSTPDAPRESTRGASYWLCGRKRLDFRRRPLVMGVLNATPDSFHPESRVDTAAAAVEQALSMAAAGADLLDLGAESSRPGAEALDPQQEISRLMPALEAVREACDLPLTIDTYHAETAAAALAAGADGINDISAGRFDPRMPTLAAETDCGLILMHMLGTPRTMQSKPAYTHVVREIHAHLTERRNTMINAGVRPERIVVDPGIGFGKTLSHNLEILKGLPEFTDLGPVLLGASRKSFIGALTGAETADRLGGSLAAVAIAMNAGVAIVRVHDVAETRQLLDVMAAARESGDV